MVPFGFFREKCSRVLSGQGWGRRIPLEACTPAAGWGEAAGAVVGTLLKVNTEMLTLPVFLSV